MFRRRPLVAAATAAIVAVTTALVPPGSLGAQGGSDPGSGHGQHAAGARRPSSVGMVTFPNRGARAAQPPLRRGLALLHNFHYDEAATAFREAQRADPALALAYWGEALTYSRVLWGVESLDSARAALGRLGPDGAARLARARSADERAFGAVVERFFEPAPLPARARTAADAARAWAAASPTLDEAQAFAALFVMIAGYRGGATPNDALLAEAAAFAQRVSDRNPRHPGAAHYLIHAWDRPETARRGLAAARAYDRIAPDADHALHMPSHIYYQLGMWAEMARSNERAWAASRARGADGRATPGNPHSLEWLQYAYLQQGRWRAARALIDTARALWGGETDAAARPDEAHATTFLAFQYGTQTGDWSPWPSARDDAAQAAFAVRGRDGGAASSRAAGMGLLRTYHEVLGAWLARGDTMAAHTAAARLRAAAGGGASAGASAGDADALRAHAELFEALVALRRGDTTAGLTTLVAQAAATPNGGPSIPGRIPAWELVAQVRLAAGDVGGATAAYDRALEGYPNRSTLLRGLVAARGAAGDGAGRARALAALRANWRAADAGVATRATAPR